MGKKQDKASCPIAGKDSPHLVTASYPIPSISSPISPAVSSPLHISINQPTADRADDTFTSLVWSKPHQETDLGRKQPYKETVKFWSYSFPLSCWAHKSWCHHRAEAIQSQNKLRWKQVGLLHKAVTPGEGCSLRLELSTPVPTGAEEACEHLPCVSFSLINLRFNLVKLILERWKVQPDMTSVQALPTALWSRTPAKMSWEHLTGGSRFTSTLCSSDSTPKQLPVHRETSQVNSFKCYLPVSFSTYRNNSQ